MTDSSTGGYLQPAAPPAPTPLEGLALLEFLLGWVVGVSGLPGMLVRPRWQPEPPDIPQSGTCWAAIGVQRRPSDEYPYSDWNALKNAFMLQRHEELVLLTSFYDTGSTGLADMYAAQFRDGAAIAQNREPLVLAGMNLVKVGDLITVPSLLKLQWLYRVDLEISIRREIDRTYPVLTLESASGYIYTDTGLPPQPFAAPSTSKPAPVVLTGEGGVVLIEG
jgi:hypothetical protein